MIFTSNIKKIVQQTSLPEISQFISLFIQDLRRFAGLVDGRMAAGGGVFLECIKYVRYTLAVRRNRLYHSRNGKITGLI